MRKLVRILLYAIGSVVLLLVVAVVAISLFVKPNEYKTEIEQAVYDQTGRKLSIDGDINLSFFPWIGVSLGKLALANPPGFKEIPFAKLDSADVHIQLLPLFKQQINISTLKLHGLAVNLIQASQDSNNWQDLAGTEGEQVAEESPESAPSSTAMPKLAINGIEIANADISFDDQVAGASYRIEDFNVTTSEIEFGEAFDLAIDFRAKLSELALTSLIKINSQVMIDLEQERYALTQLKIDVEGEGDILPVQPTKLTLSSDISLDLKQQQLSVAALVLESLGIKLKGQIQGKNIIDSPVFEGRLASDEINLRNVLKTLGIEMVTSDEKALTRTTLEAVFSATDKQARIDKLVLALDESTLSGNVAIKDFASNALAFDLLLDKLVVDRYLPPTTEAAPEPPVPEPTEPVEEVAIELPTEMLRALDINGSLKANTLVFNEMSFRDLNIGINAKEGLIKAQPMQVKLAEGNIDVTGQIDVRKEVPVYHVTQKIDDVQIFPLLEKFADFKMLSGMANTSADITTTGATVSSLKAALNGKADFIFRDGALEGINVAQTIRDGLAKMKGQSAKKGNEPNKTDFTELKGSVKITKGVVDNQDLFVAAPLLRIEGKGTADLTQDKLNYLIKTKIVGTLKGQDGKDLSELKGVTIPIRIKGDFAEPKIRPDFGTLVNEKAKQKLKEKGDEVKDQLKDKAKDLLKF